MTLKPVGVSMKASIYHQDRIVDALSKQTLTTRELSELLNLNYYTVRSNVKELQNAGTVEVVGVRNRSALFGLSDPEAIAKIPHLFDSINKRRLKAIGLAHMKPTVHKARATMAALNLPSHVIKLLMVGHFTLDDQPVDQTLSTIRQSMQNDVIFLKNMVNLYEQILDEPRFWSPELLKIMTEDPEYNYEELDRLNNLPVGEPND